MKLCPEARLRGLRDFLIEIIKSRNKYLSLPYFLSDSFFLLVYKHEKGFLWVLSFLCLDCR